MTAFVIGLGSMGKRRIRLLKEYDNNMKIVGIETSAERMKAVADEYAIEVFSSLDEAMENEKGECAFVCTSPVSHSTIIYDCLKKGLHVFTELNLISDGYDENIELAKEKNLTLFLSSTFLYRPETEYIIKRYGETKCPVDYIYHIGQYLPDWHPWESYNNFFVGNPRTNGCREIFAVELPWIVSCFGKITKIQSLKSKNTSLNLSYNDNYLVQITHENGAKGIMAVDVVSRKAVRNFEMYGEDIHITWNGTPDSVFDYDIENKTNNKIDLGFDEHRDGYAKFITENPYRNEIKDFFDSVKGGNESGKWSFEKDSEIIHVIDEIEG